MNQSIFNSQLLDVTRQAILKNAHAQKHSFVDAAAASGAGGDPAAAGGDPAAAGGMPPGGDPMAAGGMPPAGDPMAAAGGGAPPPAGDPRIDQLMTMMQQMMSQGGAGGAAGGMGGVEPIKPKIDVNVEIMQMKKLIAKLCDAMGVQVPASDMVATSQDLTQMGMQGEAGAAGGAGAAPASAISPISAMQPAMPAAPGGGEKTSQSRGSAVPRIATMRDLGNRAGAMAAVLRAQLSQ